MRPEFIVVNPPRFDLLPGMFHRDLPIVLALKHPGEPSVEKCMTIAGDDAQREIYRAELRWQPIGTGNQRRRSISAAEICKTPRSPPSSRAPRRTPGPSGAGLML